MLSKYYKYKNKYNKLKKSIYGGATGSIIASHPINIISWNLCFGCLGNNKADKTAQYIVDKCIENTVPKSNPVNYHCFENIIKNINRMKEKNIDIFAFQEATIELSQINFIDRTLNYYNKYVTLADSAVLISYVHKKYTCRLIQEDNILYGNGRPIHLLKISLDNIHFYFINLHNKQDSPVITIRRLINRYITEDIPIIMAGDFNETTDTTYWKEFRIRHKKLYTSSKPPETCCLNDSDNEYTYPGDYILSTNGSTNEIFDLEPLLTSDHLPILGKVILQPTPEITQLLKPTQTHINEKLLGLCKIYNYSTQSRHNIDILQEIVELLNQGADLNYVNENFISALDILCEIKVISNVGSFPMRRQVEYVDKGKIQTKLLETAIDMNYLNAVNKIIETNLATSEMFSVLTYALEKKAIPVIEMLLNTGVSINLCDSNGRSLLIYLITYTQIKIDFLTGIEMFKYLISKKADVNLPDNWNRTPLSYAINNEEQDSTKTIFTDILIENNANVNCYLHTGETPLSYAIKNDKQQLFMKLIEQCSDVNTFDNNYITPLISAISSGNKFFIDTLLKNGSNHSCIKRRHLDLIDEPYKTLFETEISMKKETCFLYNNTHLEKIDMLNSAYIWYHTDPLKELSNDDNNFVFELLMKYSFPCYLSIPNDLSKEEKARILVNEYSFIQDKINERHPYIKIMSVPRIIYDLLHINFKQVKYKYYIPVVEAYSYDCQTGITYETYCDVNKNYNMKAKDNIFILNERIVNLIFNNNIKNFNDILDYIYEINSKKITTKYNEHFDLLHNYKEYFRKFIQIESEPNSGNFILYRGANIKNDKLVSISGYKTVLSSISLNQSILNAITTDKSACTFLYFINDKSTNTAMNIYRPNKKIDRIKYVMKKHFHNDESDEAELFFIPPLHPYIQLLSIGELWHPRTKISNIIEKIQTVRKGSLKCDIKTIKEGHVLLSKNKSMEELQCIYDGFRMNGNINTFIKYFHNKT